MTGDERPFNKYERTIRVHVTAADFEGAQYGSITDCPIARGLRRELPFANITVGGYDTTINGTSIDLPPEALEGIRPFWELHQEKPFDFELILKVPRFSIGDRVDRVDADLRTATVTDIFEFDSSIAERYDSIWIRYDGDPEDKLFRHKADDFRLRIVNR